MKKYIASIVIPLTIMSLAIVFFASTPEVHAQVSCPAGYTCTPISSGFNCPSGFVCQPTFLPSPSPTPTACYTFSRNLGIGATGDDVVRLINILSSEGVLPFRASTYNGGYDESIASAVSAFQQKYASQILTPSGLTSGTGYVGKATRAKLNQMCATPMNSTGDVSTSNNQNTAYISSVGSPANPASSFYPGDRVTIVGSGFPQNSTVELDQVGTVSHTIISALANASGQDQNVTFMAPTNLYPTSYRLYLISSPNGGSQISNAVYVTVMAKGSSNNTPNLAVSCSGTPFPSGVPGASWSAQANGSNPPYQYSWSVYNDVSSYGEGSTQSSAFMVNYQSGGTKQAVVRVTDASGMSISSTCSVTVGSNTTNSNQPYITSVNPTYATANSVVSVYGTNLTGATEVDLANTSGQIFGTINNSVQNNITVSAGGSPLQFVVSPVMAYNVNNTTQLRVVTPSGASNYYRFGIITPNSSQPNITNISPSQGTVNSTVTVYGSNLNGATEVDFYNSSNQLMGSINNSVQNNITVSSSGSPLQFVLSGAFAANVTGALQVRVVTPSGTSNSLPFTITAPNSY